MSAPYSPPPRTPEWRHPVVIALAAVLALLVVVVGAGLIARGSAATAALPPVTATTGVPVPPQLPEEVLPEIVEQQPPVEITEPTIVQRVQVQPGMCLLEYEFLASVGTDLEYYTQVPCSTPHAAEVVKTFTVPDGPWPGQEQLEGPIMRDGCYPLFDSLLPLIPHDLATKRSWLVPGQYSWENSGIRNVTCAVTITDRLVTGSLLLGETLVVV